MPTKYAFVSRKGAKEQSRKGVFFAVLHTFYLKAHIIRTWPVAAGDRHIQQAQENA
jgi:hypothetical protein